MRIIRERQSRERMDGGERRTYYDQDDASYALAITAMPKHHRQNMHAHAEIVESIIVLSGNVWARERIGSTDAEAVQELKAGDLVVFGCGPFHSIETRGEPAVLVTLKILSESARAQGFQDRSRDDWIPFHE